MDHRLRWDHGIKRLNEEFAGIGYDLPNHTTLVLEKITKRTLNSIGSPLRESVVLCVRSHSHEPYCVWYRRVEYGQKATGEYQLLDVTSYGAYHRDFHNAVEDFNHRIPKRAITVEPAYGEG